MKKNVIAALVLAAFTTAASAEEIGFRTDSDAPERVVAEALFRDFIAQRIGMSLETALVDLDGDGVGEVATRFVHSSTCSASGPCRTVVVRHEGNRWQAIADVHAHVISLGRAGEDGMKDITVDDVVWTWRSGGYQADVAAMGSVVTFESIGKSTALSLADVFGPAAVPLIEADLASISAAMVDVDGDGSTEVIARLDGAVVCGTDAGCPVRVLVEENGAWSVVIETYADGPVAVSKIAREGHRDVIASRRGGYLSHGWNGKAYVLSSSENSIAGIQGSRAR